MNESAPARVCLIVNPASGRGRALRRLDAMRRLWRSEVTIRPTERPGHAEQLAHAAALEGFDVVAAAGGDGTVHEVANGLLAADRPEVRFAVVPLGSANDYAASLELDESSGGWRRVDVGVVHKPDGHSRAFVCCLGLGFGGSVTFESRRLGHLQGKLLYGAATLAALVRHWHHVGLTIRTDDGEPISARVLLASLMVGRREGGFVIAPDARLDDGQLDLVLAGPLSRWGVLGLLPGLAIRGAPRNDPRIRVLTCRRVTIESDQPLFAHADGELIAIPADDVRRLEAELLPGRLEARVGLD